MTAFAPLNRGHTASVEEGGAASSSTADSPQGWRSDEGRFKVFISYSRRDSADFAKRLVEALETHSLAAKLDTRDLEFGEKWQAQLKDFIRQADTIVYVVSPKSIEIDMVPLGGGAGRSAIEAPRARRPHTSQRRTDPRRD